MTDEPTPIPDQSLPPNETSSHTLDSVMQEITDDCQELERIQEELSQTATDIHLQELLLALTAAGVTPDLLASALHRMANVQPINGISPLNEAGSFSYENDVSSRSCAAGDDPEPDFDSDAAMWAAQDAAVGPDHGHSGHAGTPGTPGHGVLRRRTARSYLTRTATVQFQLLIVSEDGQLLIEGFNDAEACRLRLIALLAEDVDVVPMIGHRCYLSQPRHGLRYLMTPGGNLPLFDLPTPDALEADLSTYVGRQYSVPPAPATPNDEAGNVVTTRPRRPIAIADTPESHEEPELSDEDPNAPDLFGEP